MTCRRLVLCLLSLYRWPSWLIVKWLAVTPLFRTSLRRGQSWWVPWNLLQIHPSLLVCAGQLGWHIKPPTGCGVLITILDGRWPYFSVRLLLTWHDLHDLHDLHDFITNQRVVCIPFQYTAPFIVPSRRLCPGCWREWWYHIVACRCKGFGITSLPLWQMHFWSSMIQGSSPLSRVALCLKNCLSLLSAFWASTIFVTVRGYISSSSLWFGNTAFSWIILVSSESFCASL